jgi:hypothetical protein
MNKEKKSIFMSTVIKNLFEKKFDGIIENAVMPISMDDVRKKFYSTATRLGFNFNDEYVKNLDLKLFSTGFMAGIIFENETERDLEEMFRTIENLLEIHYSLRMQGFMWFSHGYQAAIPERRTLSVFYHLNQNICKLLDLEATEIPDPKVVGQLFRNLDKEIFDEIDVDNNVIESSCAEIAFQCGYLLALNLGELDEDFLNWGFDTILREFLQDMEPSDNEILAYYIVFKEGYKSFKK